MIMFDAGRTYPQTMHSEANFILTTAVFLLASLFADGTFMNQRNHFLQNVMRTPHKMYNVVTTT